MALGCSGSDPPGSAAASTGGALQGAEGGAHGGAEAGPSSGGTSAGPSGGATPTGGAVTNAGAPTTQGGGGAPSSGGGPAVQGGAGASAAGGGGAAGDDGSEVGPAGPSELGLDAACSELDSGTCLCLPSSTPPTEGPLLCTAASVNGVCCGSPGYPDDFSTCTCRPWRCEEGNGTCNCSTTGQEGSSSRCTPGSYNVCCMSERVGNTSCYCDDIFSSCDASYYEVDNCVADNVECEAGQERRDMCRFE